ncbi:MAG: 4Fe-4S binding protein [Deltaproteobacteria bacterium]|jgi:polyferredoxin|nr:4Fe-4S binding protein [Deltaproteobacteria bacterium]
MTVTKLRYIVQHAGFFVFTYGGYFRINLGSSIPCLSCPFVYSCTGYCYLMMFQRALGLLFMPLTSATAGPDPWAGVWSNFLNLLTGLAFFSVLVIILGKSWCGWLCPFGLFQDWITRLRRKLNIRESEIVLKHKEKLSVIKYVLLGYLIIFPLMASLGWLPVDFILAFCNICPAKALMPLFAGDIQYLALDVSTAAALGFSLALLLVTASFLIGMFFKDRFFCLFCPMLALMNFYKALYLLKLTKEPLACHGCGNCRRTCAMDNETVYRERIKSNVYDADCMGCFKCAESCAADQSLMVKLGPLKLFKSSRRYAARL